MWLRIGYVRDLNMYNLLFLGRERIDLCCFLSELFVLTDRKHRYFNPLFFLCQLIFFCQIIFEVYLNKQKNPIFCIKLILLNYF